MHVQRSTPNRGWVSLEPSASRGRSGGPVLMEEKLVACDITHMFERSRVKKMKEKTFSRTLMIGRSTYCSPNPIETITYFSS